MVRETIVVPEEVTAETDRFDLTVEGPNGSVTRRLWYPNVLVSVEEVEVEAEIDRDDGDDGDGNESESGTETETETETETTTAVVIESEAEDRKTAATIGSFASHVRNALYGVTDGWEYGMEVFYSHFPMQVRAEGGAVVIENFLGERAPRRTAIHGGTEVEVDGEAITLRGPDKEAVGQTAAGLEQLTRVSSKDARVFQDGVYIVEKPSRSQADLEAEEAEVIAGGE